jgi:hypothetical protein
MNKDPVVSLYVEVLVLNAAMGELIVLLAERDQVFWPTYSARMANLKADLLASEPPDSSIREHIELAFGKYLDKTGALSRRFTVIQGGKGDDLPDA